MKFFEFVLKFLRRRNSLGYRAETAAVKFLKKEKKFKILQRNYRHKHLETDIICFDKFSNSIVFIEVKCRPYYAKVRGFYSATSKKKTENLRKCAKEFLRENRAFNQNFRFSVVEVIHNEKGEFTDISLYETR